MVWGRLCAPGLFLLRRMQKLSEFDKVVSSRPAPFGGGGLTIPSGITAAPSKFGLSVCGKAIVGSNKCILKAWGAILGGIFGVVKAVLGGYVVHLGPQKGHAADLGSHFVAKRATKNQHKRPETEIW